jgi:sulfur carrier protein
VRVTLNGTVRDVPEGARVREVLAACGVAEDEGALAVAVEGEVVPRRAWRETVVPEDARIEVVRPAAGG